jgi:hypothetical protein
MVPMATLATRDVEQAKAAYFAQRAQALIDRGREIRVGRYGHATAFVWPGFNRVYGFGAEDLRRLGDVLDWFADAEESPVFEIAPGDGAAEVEQRLAAKKFRARGTQAVLTGPSAADRPAPVDVRWIEAHERPAWAALYVRSYEWDVPADDPIEEELVAQYAGDGWHLCVAEIDGAPVAMGALHAGRPPIAYLANAGTLPSHRGRGCQASIIARRAALAAAKGFEWVAADTEPGSGSQRNLERAGLSLAYRKTRWERAS